MTDKAGLLGSLYPRRDGPNIYVDIGGERMSLSPMQANLILRAWAEAVGGAMVFQASSLSPYGGSPCKAA
ncbi:MAG: hypothetical protein J0H18_11235 [Rhizobiales bacterium]|nr:hypothetical protein [Hyphomicrobiales bacterium]